MTQSKWERMVKNKDDAEVWRAVNWAGEVELDNNQDIPFNEEFKGYVESTQKLLCVPIPCNNIKTQVTIPVLDEQISVFETEREARGMKINRACGPDVLTLRIFKMLSIPWLLAITTIFNSIFSGGIYLITWSSAKIFAIYKGGSTRSRNYRGISVINSCVGFYDLILWLRLKQFV